MQKRLNKVPPAKNMVDIAENLVCSAAGTITKVAVECAVKGVVSKSEIASPIISAVAEKAGDVVQKYCYLAVENPQYAPVMFPFPPARVEGAAALEAQKAAASVAPKSVIPKAATPKAATFKAAASVAPTVIPKVAKPKAATSKAAASVERKAATTQAAISATPKAAVAPEATPRTSQQQSNIQISAGLKLQLSGDPKTIGKQFVSDMRDLGKSIENYVSPKSSFEMRVTGWSVPVRRKGKHDFEVLSYKDYPLHIKEKLEPERQAYIKKWEIRPENEKYLGISLLSGGFTANGNAKEDVKAKKLKMAEEEKERRKANAAFKKIE